ncbi:GNAT family N-acetyltransferase [Salipiger mucosus]|uniref:GCN5-related protein N-acetyltransferase n=1 Tax=Salipiger mucosus DSM 16094 TaxID=1123237 RepID=S9QVB9_9RHOB|nr:GNAT family N-acetyltransferase [Salipiger mucosus]EPX83543.1 GCN5-related protein N-acetyltransferase [Salipiger mucosus DSM 16094]
MQIRDAEENDIDAITEIYNDAVRNTTAIWNDNVVDRDNRLAWWRERLRVGYPVLVAQSDEGKIVGYATFGDWRAFDGYRFSVEHSVYVLSSERGGGIGRTLMIELMQRARDLDKHVMVAGIEAGNVASIRLHEKLGFEKVGQISEVGTKFGKWLDLAFMQVKLDGRLAPAPSEDVAS